MAETIFAISDFAELYALHKTILEAKFSEAPLEEEIASSPQVAAVANRVFDTLIELEREAHGEERAQAWEDWRLAAPNRREWVIAAQRVDREGLWSGWSAEEKRDFATRLLSPFVVTDALLEDFISEVDSNQEA